MPLDEEDEFDIPSWAENLRAMLAELDEEEIPTKKRLATCLSQTLDIVVEMVQRMVIQSHDIKTLDKLLAKTVGIKDIVNSFKEEQEQEDNLGSVLDMFS